MFIPISRLPHKIQYWPGGTSDRLSQIAAAVWTALSSDAAEASASSAGGMQTQPRKEKKKINGV